MSDILALVKQLEKERGKPVQITIDTPCTSVTGEGEVVGDLSKRALIVRKVDELDPDFLPFVNTLAGSYGSLSALRGKIDELYKDPSVNQFRFYGSIPFDEEVFADATGVYHSICGLPAPVPRITKVAEVSVAYLS